MARLSTVALQGRSARAYVCDVWPAMQAFNEVGAVYAITRRYQDGDTYRHDIIYIGQTGDLSTRFADHHKQDCFNRRQANCACTYLDADEDARLGFEADLISNYSPPCND